MVDLKNGKVILKTSQEDVIRVETTVSYKNANEALYDQLSKGGRYDLALSTNAPVTLSNKPRDIVKVSGANLEEEVSYVVIAPADIKVEDTNSLAFGNKKGKAKAKAKAKAKKKK